MIRLFPELRPILEEASELAPVGGGGCAKAGAQVAQSVAQQPYTRTGKKRQKSLASRGVGEIVRRLAMGCQRPEWWGQDANESRAPRETVTSSPPALQKAVHLMQPITS